MEKENRRNNSNRTIENFIAENVQNDTMDEKAKLNELLYFLANIVYLKGLNDKNINYKLTFVTLWRNNTGMRLNDESWKFATMKYSTFLKPENINALLMGKQITNERNLLDILVRLTFNKWLLSADSGEMTKNNFRDYVNKKFGDGLGSKVNNFLKWDLFYINDLQGLKEKIRPYINDIEKVYTIFYTANREQLQTKLTNLNNQLKDDYYVVSKYNNDNKKQLDTERAKKINENIIKQKSSEQIVTNEKKGTDGKQQAAIGIPENDELKKAKRAIEEYKIRNCMLKEEIEKLEQDIQEYKRQKNDLSERILSEYDQGIRNLIKTLNNSRYSKPLDYLYQLMECDSTDDVLKSYLENFFMALEEMDIEPMNPNRNLSNINKSTLSAEYNLDFDINTIRENDKIKIKYIGWKYNGKCREYIIEKPTLTRGEK